MRLNTIRILCGHTNSLLPSWVSCPITLKSVRRAMLALALKADDQVIWESRLYYYSYHPELSAEAIFGEFVRWGDRFSALSQFRLPSTIERPGGACA